MGQRKITIQETAVHAVAQISFFIEGKGLAQTAKQFVDEAFLFFDKLADERFTDRPCGYLPWGFL